MENEQVKGIALEKFTWKIEAFSKMSFKKLSSKAFKVGGRLLYPKGTNEEHLSLYMKIADTLPPYGWSRFVYFRLALINQVDSKKSIVKETQQKFNAGNSGWGSPSFIPLSEFHDPNQGYLVNDTCIIEAQISVSKVAFSIIKKSDGDQPRLTQDQLKELQKIPSDVTLSPTSTHDSKDDQLSEREVQFFQSEDKGIGPSDMTPSPKQVQFVPSAPPMYPPLFNESEEAVFLTLSDLIDLKNLEPEEAIFIPLWEEVCSWHPSLVENQKRRSPRFILWAFTALGRILHFLKTKKIRDMGEDNCMHLQILWEELQPFGFDLTWLEPHVESALGAKGYLERAEHLKKVRVNVAALEIELRRLKAKLAVAELDLGVARRDLAEVEKGFEEKDMNAQLGYGMP
ncbi:TRAF-like [Sesbania bispinosa]|nr:TRAF-like [Sesbania bispinosa]